RHFEAARDAGYRPALFDGDSPQTYLSRLDKKAALAAKVTRPALASQANQPDSNAPAPAPAPAPGPDAANPPANGKANGEDLRSTAIMQDVQRRQKAAESRRLTQEGRQAQDQNDLATARDRYQRAVNLDPTNTEAAQGLDEVLRLRGELPGAPNGSRLTQAQA